MTDAIFLTPQRKGTKTRLSRAEILGTPLRAEVKKKTFLEISQSDNPMYLLDGIAMGLSVRRSKDKNPEEGRPNSDYYRKIYTKYCGVIREGFQIHHIDMNPQNCSIANLVAIPTALHQKLHSVQYAQEKIISWLKNPESYRLCPKNDIKIILNKIKDLPETLREYRDYILYRNKILIERYKLPLPPVSDISDIVDSLFTLRSERTQYSLRDSSPRSKKRLSRLGNSTHQSQMHPSKLGSSTSQSERHTSRLLVLKRAQATTRLGAAIRGL